MQNNTSSLNQNKKHPTKIMKILYYHSGINLGYAHLLVTQCEGLFSTHKNNNY